MEFFFKKLFWTCTFHWLMRNRDIYHKYIENITDPFNKITEKRIVEYFLSTNFSKMKIDCNFESRLNKCNETQFNSSENLDENHTFTDVAMSFQLAHFIQIKYILPITCTFSIQ